MEQFDIQSLGGGHVDMSESQEVALLFVAY